MSSLIKYQNESIKGLESDLVAYEQSLKSFESDNYELLRLIGEEIEDIDWRIKNRLAWAHVPSMHAKFISIRDAARFIRVRSILVHLAVLPHKLSEPVPLPKDNVIYVDFKNKKREVA